MCIQRLDERRRSPSLPNLALRTGVSPLSEEKPKEPLHLIRRILPLTSVALIIALIYVGWTFVARWQENRSLEQKQAEAAAENNRKVLDTLGGNEMKILNLSLDRGLIRKGEKLTLCYGVMNARKVRIDPPPNVETWPSQNRCFEVAPRVNTKYTLTAEDANGHTQTASVEVHVQ